MNKNHNNTSTHRQCTRCREVKVLTSEAFPLDKQRPFGFGYVCRLCERARSLEKNKRYPRIGRYSLMTEQQRRRVRDNDRKYSKTPNGIAISYANAYKKADAKKGLENDIDWRWIASNIFGRACYYCGDSRQIGCDRIDNSIGHLKTNVVLACGDCNVARSNRFTHQEMRAIGAAIRLVKLARVSAGVEIVT